MEAFLGGVLIGLATLDINRLWLSACRGVALGGGIYLAVRVFA
ncbi:hypothetical protein [Phenylobacterium sp. J367]|nr:hypothetical protein [Phenylobacterium sp. J367]